jgi:hypothetical protein
MERREAIGLAPQLPFATPEQIPAGFWDDCPFCDGPVFLPVAGGRDAKGRVRCPACQGAIQPDC